MFLATRFQAMKEKIKIPLTVHLALGWLWKFDDLQILMKWTATEVTKCLGLGCLIVKQPGEKSYRLVFLLLLTRSLTDWDFLTKSIYDY